MLYKTIYKCFVKLNMIYIYIMSCHTKPSVFTWQLYFVALRSNNLKRVAEVLHKLYKSLQEMHPNLMITISFSLSITLCHMKYIFLHMILLINGGRSFFKIVGKS